MLNCIIIIVLCPQKHCQKINLSKTSDHQVLKEQTIKNNTIILHKKLSQVRLLYKSLNL